MKDISQKRIDQSAAEIKSIGERLSQITNNVNDLKPIIRELVIVTNSLRIVCNLEED